MRWSASQALSQIICGEPLKLENREWKREMGAGIAAAQRKLAMSISRGKVQAFGRRNRHGALENVPGDIFRIADVEVVVSPHGNIASLRPHRGYEGEPWESIEFEEAEIKQEFPSPPKQSIQEWMYQEAERYRADGKIGKREFMLKDCQKVTGCTSREAKAAYNLLPDHLKLKRGKPAKHAV
jgi:hypothetical protein